MLYCVKMDLVNVNLALCMIKVWESGRMKETKIVKKEIEVEKSAHTCDICKSRTIEEDRSWGTSADLNYRENNGVRAKGDKHIIDVCTHCVARKVMPLVCDTFDVTPRTED